jgi:hypothetical protein
MTATSEHSLHQNLFVEARYISVSHIIVTHMHVWVSAPVSATPLLSHPVCIFILSFPSDNSEYENSKMDEHQAFNFVNYTEATG